MKANHCPRIGLVLIIISITLGISACKKDAPQQAPAPVEVATPVESEEIVEIEEVVEVEETIVTTTAEPVIPQEVTQPVTDAADGTAQVVEAATVAVVETTGAIVETVVEATEITTETVVETAQGVAEAVIETAEGATQAVAETAEDVVEAVIPPDVKMVPIPLELPKPMFVGTPQNLKVPNLQKPLGKPRPPFYAPEGTANIALGKAVSSSDEEPVIGEIEMITDGDKDASDGSFVELGPFDQYITIDLGAQHEVYAVIVWHFHKQPRVYFDVVVQLSDDPDFAADVKTIFNNDIDNLLGFGDGSDMNYVETAEGKLIDAKGSKARYVRLHSSGNNANELNHYIEVDVYGKPTE